MKTVIANEDLNVPIKMWLDKPNEGALSIEEGALEQAKNLARLPFVFKHVAIMPDSHVGYGMPIGGVLATKNAIVPNAVGIDIGCGLCSLKTSLTVDELNKSTLKKIMGGIRKRVPVGFSHHKKEQDSHWMPGLLDYCIEPHSITSKNFTKGMFQIGTLGGGNHFIEIQVEDNPDKSNEELNVYIMIHSGSRNIGLQIAKHYNNLAKELNQKWHSNTRTDLSFLPVNTEEFYQYVCEMKFAIQFALQNRKLMLERVKKSFIETFDQHIEFSNFINIPHNYVELENHFGSNVLVHRKGATRAREGELGIIPGSQGTNSYIVKGKGNVHSFQSCSHGAGRTLGRKEAQRKLNLKEQQKMLNEQGIIHSVRNEKDLDEAPDSYKNIDIVMEYQKDLIEVVTKLRPLAVVKG